MHSVKPPLCFLTSSMWTKQCNATSAGVFEGLPADKLNVLNVHPGASQKQRIWVFKPGRASFGRSRFFPRNTWVNDPEPSSLCSLGPGWARLFGLDPRRSRHVKSKCFPHFPSVLVEMPTYACQASCLLKGDQVRASFWRASFWLFYFALGRWNFKAPGHFRNLWNLVPLREMMRNDPLQVTWFLIVTLHPRPSYLCILGLWTSVKHSFAQNSVFAWRSTGMNNTLWVYVCVRLIFDEWHPPTSPTRTKMEACSRVGCILHVKRPRPKELCCAK